MYSDSKCFKKRNFNSSKKGTNNDASNESCGCIPVTPQMIRAAVKRLHLRRAFVNTNLISQYLRRSYPVENDLRLFSEELKKKLDCAVRVGLIVKHGEDAYCLPTLREEANIFDTLCTTFWEIYRNYPGTAQTRYQNRKRSTTKKKKRLEGPNDTLYFIKVYTVLRISTDSLLRMRWDRDEL
ncbi:uncharacterized protein LOC105663386 [Megachile rotundata]|uniref:uncharacterized protein LOC105663386 n=1 Tax=Megachile rotundata TaxID=143995 RepID=UPI003FD1035F